MSTPVAKTAALPAKTTAVPTVTAAAAAVSTARVTATKAVAARKPAVPSKAVIDKASTAKKVAVKPAVAGKPAAPKPAVKPAVPVLTKPVKTAKKPKLVRDSFTIPKAEYAVLDELKQRAAQLTQGVKKSELLRAGIKALAALSDAAFLNALKQVPAIKTGRPTTGN